MDLKKIKFNLKIFKIDKLYYEFKNKTDDEIVEIIRENHKKHLHASSLDINIVKPVLQSHEEDEFKYYTYCYNQPKEQDYWKLFLPELLVEKQNFQIIEFSFVLFIIYNSNIYCLLAGSGINVVKRYIDNYFGINVYQHFARPNDDISLVVNTRGVTGNLSQRSNTYNNLQSVTDSLLYSEVPKKLKIVMRQDLINGLFKKYEINEDNALMEVGAFFSLRKKLTFDELKCLIVDIEKITSDKKDFVKLSLFNRISEPELLTKLDDQLKSKVVDDILLHGTPDRLSELKNDIVEVTNFKKIEKYLECNKYRLHFKRKRILSDRIVSNRFDLYEKITKYIYENIENIDDRFKIQQKLYQLSIIGMIDENEVTFGTFYEHLIAEMPFDGKKFFRIDNNWFELDNRFLEQINQEAINSYNLYELKKDILLPWKSGDEDLYNKSHSSKNHFIFDKKYKENIELCDIMYIDNNDIYMIHVKDGFDTNLRSLYSQITIASQRLWNDINNATGSSYFINTTKYYNKYNPNKLIDGQALLENILSAKYKVHFVMAYRNNSKKLVDHTAIDKINNSKSNIAKFSLVQTVSEIRNFKQFEIHLKDISTIN